ncbi:MAG: class I SAM-dependent methyltransferase [Thermoleophilaceae bacterium]
MRLPIPLPLGGGPDAISPTAHYTGHVWVRNGLSHPELATLEGRVMFDAIEPAMIASRVVGGPTLERMLLARHRLIDDLLTRSIDDGRIGQVIEIACGMSPRGWRFAERYGDEISYVEADLPDMAARKRRALEKIGSLSDAHRVVELDALRDRGRRSLATVASKLDRERGLAIVTEGLLTYFPDEDVLGMWRRFARELGRFSSGLYLADLRLRGTQGPLDHGFVALLSAFVQRSVHAHFDGEGAAVEALLDAGFGDARLHQPDPRIHIVEARTG